MRISDLSSDVCSYDLAGDYVKIDLTSRIKFGQVALDLYVQNLTNEDVYTFRGTSDTGRDFFGYRMRPRTIGARLNYDFCSMTRVARPSIGEATRGAAAGLRPVTAFILCGFIACPLLGGTV